MDNIISASLYTILVMVVAAYYYFQGHKKGIDDTVGVINTIDPSFLTKVRPKLQELANGTETDS